MSDLLLMLVFLPMAAGPFGFWMGLRYPKARDTFVLAVAVLETMMVVSLWTSPVLESGIDGFCGLGIRFVSGDFHTLMATLTATGWLAATIFCREYMGPRGPAKPVLPVLAHDPGGHHGGVPVRRSLYHLYLL